LGTENKEEGNKTMSKFASLDFETANYRDPSICAAAVAVFEDDRLVDSFYSLLRPPKGFGYFREDFTECHGLNWFDVREAPEFLTIAPQLLDRLANADMVIAHNAQFDLRKLGGTLDHFGLACPTLPFLCTLCISRRIWPDLPDHKLGTVSAHIGHSFQHHHAGPDAEAAGRVLLAMMKQAGVTTPRELAHAVGIECGCFPGRKLVRA
jgi:DNA polymerase III subunit epsilon